MKSTCYLCDKQVEAEELEVGKYPICDECVKRMENEDKLDPTANTETELMEVVRNYGIENQKLKKENKDLLSANINMHDALDLKSERIQELRKKLATAVEALKEVERSKYGMQFRRDRNPAIAKQALAEIGGEDE